MSNVFKGMTGMTDQEDKKQNESSDAEAKDEQSDEKDQMIATLTQDLAKAQSEAKENFDKYLRVLADMQNRERRSEREKQEARQFALESFFSDLIPSLDSLERALKLARNENVTTGNDTSLAAGLELVQKQLLEVTQKFGLEPVQSVGSVFDPNIHQAIKRVENDALQNETVKEQYSTGYVLNGRLLRPAMVLVEVPGSGDVTQER